MNRKLMFIRTPEGIVFPMQVAGPITRFLGWIIDCVVVLLATSILSTVLRLVAIASPDLYSAVSAILYFVLSLSYPMATEWYWRGQTLGKRLLKMRVIDHQGLRLHFSQIVIRNLLRCIDVLPAVYMVGGIANLLSARGQRLGDLAANTIVISVRRVNEPDLDQILPDKYNSFQAYPHLAGRLRQHVTPQQAGIALQALMRRGSLDPQARVELFAEMASLFREIARFPQETTDGLSDEQYVRNVVDILFKSR